MVGWIKINALSFLVLSVLLLGCCSVAAAQSFTVAPGWTLSSGGDADNLPTPQPSPSPTPTLTPTVEPGETQPSPSVTVNPTEQPTVNPSNSPDPLEPIPVTPEFTNVGLLIILCCAITFIGFMAVLKWREII